MECAPRFRVAAPSIRIVPWAARASCWPLPQQLLPVSATGGGRRRCSGKNIYISQFWKICGFSRIAFSGKSRGHFRRFLRKRGAAGNPFSQALTRQIPLCRCATKGSPQLAWRTAGFQSIRSRQKKIRKTTFAQKGTADSLFQNKENTRPKYRVSISPPCSARCARTAPTRLRSRHGRRCAPDT